MIEIEIIKNIANDTNHDMKEKPINNTMNSYKQTRQTRQTNCMHVMKTGYQLEYTQYNENRIIRSGVTNEPNNDNNGNDNINAPNTHTFHNSPSPYICEVSLSDIQSAIYASIGGVNSIELCVDRNAGGITPSYGLIKQVTRYFQYSDVQVHVLIRPKCGDFVYTHVEFQLILDDIDMCMQIGVDGKCIGGM